MGLDITAYRKIKLIDAVFDADGEPIDPVTRGTLDYDLWASVNDNFPGRADEIKHQGVYTADDSFGFRAGSYGGYNRWRETLAQIAGYPEGEYDQYNKKWRSRCVACWNGVEGPFSELINFSDCEGTIGAAVSVKLSKDFADFQAKADAVEDPYFRDRYAEWRKAFEMASDAGAVSFH